MKIYNFYEKIKILKVLYVEEKDEYYSCIMDVLYIKQE